MTQMMATQANPADGPLTAASFAGAHGTEQAGDDKFAYKYLLMFRFGLVNAIGFALAFAAWVEGWLDAAFMNDQTYLVAVIIGTFLMGLIMTAQKLWQISCELNSLQSGSIDPTTRAGQFLRLAGRTDSQGRANLIASLRLKLGTRIGIIKNIANGLVILGLIGTVIGFIIALSGVDPNAVADVSAIGPMVSVLIGGMSVALYTTLMGSVLNVWLTINYRILETGTVNFLTKLAETGEHNARS